MLEQVSIVETLLAGDKLDQAVLEIDLLLSQHKNDRRYYLDIIDCLLDHERYDEATRVTNLYKENTGKPLRGDVSLNEIKQLKKVSKDVKHQGSKFIFRFLSIRERGFLSGMRRLIKIAKIIIDEDRISFCTRFKTRSYNWHDAQSVYIVKQKLDIGYIDSYTQHVLVFEFPDTKEMIDVTPVYPDYAGNKLLLRQIKKRVEVKEYKNRKIYIFNWHAVFILAPFFVSALMIHIFGDSPWRW